MIGIVMAQIMANRLNHPLRHLRAPRPIQKGYRKITDSAQSTGN